MTDDRPVFKCRYEWQTPNGKRQIQEHVCRGFDEASVRGILTQRADVLRIIEVRRWER